MVFWPSTSSLSFRKHCIITLWRWQVKEILILECFQRHKNRRGKYHCLGSDKDQSPNRIQRWRGNIPSTLRVLFKPDFWRTSQVNRFWLIYIFYYICIYFYAEAYFFKLLKVELLRKFCMKKFGLQIVSLWKTYNPFVKLFFCFRDEFLTRSFTFRDRGLSQNFLIDISYS